MSSSSNNVRTPRKPLCSQMKEMLCKLNKYFKDVNDKDMSSVVTSSRLVSTSTGIPLSTVKRALLEGKRVLENGGKFKSPKKTRCRKKIIVIGVFDKAVIRRIIYDFHITDNQGLSMKILHDKLKKEINYPGSTTSLRKEISLLGFKWKRTEDNDRILIEKHEIRYLRVNFLIKIAEYRAQGRPIVYTSETCIDPSHTLLMSTSGKAPLPEGNQLIVIHAGGEDGFVPNALHMFQATKETGDDHHIMSSENYIEWLQTQLIPNLKPNSVVVVGNAPYHNLLQNPAPNSNHGKKAMIDWLTYWNIDHSASMLKPQLYQLILQNKARFIEYKIDSLLREHGHSVLRQPPNHPDFNPIENIWPMIKGHVAQKINEYVYYNMVINMDTLMAFTNEKVDAITAHEWKNICDHVLKEEKAFYSRDVAIDSITERVINNTGSDMSSDESEDEDAMTGVEDL